MRTSKLLLLLFTLLLAISACRNSSSLISDEMIFSPSDLSFEELSALVQDYSNLLHSIQGEGRAVVSEPGNSERISVRFYSSREESLIFVRNSAGIEGGQIYLDTDSLTILNRVDRVAEKVPLDRSDRSSVGSLASMNILQLFHYPVFDRTVTSFYESSDHYKLITDQGSQIIVSKGTGTVHSVVHANNNRFAPYSRIDFDSYMVQDAFLLPGRITVTSKDGLSRVTLIVRRLEVNSDLPDLELTIPDNIPLLRL